MSFDAEKVFRDEAEELLADMEQMLLELEDDPRNQDCIAKVFRDIHTIKGSGAMFGFDELTRFTHDLENLFDLVRSGQIPLERQLLSLALQAKDHIHVLLDSPTQGQEVKTVSDGLISAFRAYLTPQGSAPPPSCPEPKGRQARDKSRTRTWLIRYRPDRSTFLSGTDPLGLIGELEGLGQLWCFFRQEAIPKLEELDPQVVLGWWDLLLISDKGLDALKDVFIFVDDGQQVEYGEVFPEPIREADLPGLSAMIDTGQDKSFHELLELLATEVSVKAGQRAPAPGRAPGPAAPESHGPASLRVDSNRMDAFVNLVGELVIVQSRLSQAVTAFADANLNSIAEDLQRLATDMRDQALGIRMVPIGSIFGALRRLVRDLCGQMDKDVELVVDGAQTELDKNLIDQLKGPLVHILRNSIDHSIEAPQVRAAAGKPLKGRIGLKAEHSGGSIAITIADDGAGVDLERVRAKAVENGLIAPSDNLSDKELLHLIFTPGFSTAQKVTDVSGRGVGMDVVKKNIEGLRGSVEMTSIPGQGATLAIRLPLTTAIIDGLQVLVGREFYILPLTAIVACQERFIQADPPVVGTMEYRGELIPCVSIRKLLEVPGDQPGYERIIVVKVSSQMAGLAVDMVVGQQQAVIKPLAEMLAGARFICGTTVNGDGGMSMILDAPYLIKLAQERASHPPTP